MSEEAKKNLEAIGEKLRELPPDAAAAVTEQFAAYMEGFAAGFAAGKAHAEKKEGE